MLNKINEMREERKEAREAKKQAKKARKMNGISKGQILKNAARSAAVEVAADGIGLAMMGAVSGTMYNVATAAVNGGVNGYYSANGVPVIAKKHRFSKAVEMNRKQLGSKKYYSVTSNTWWDKNPHKARAIDNGIAGVSLATGACAGVTTRCIVKNAAAPTSVIDNSGFTDITDESIGQFTDAVTRLYDLFEEDEEE